MFEHMSTSLENESKYVARIQLPDDGTPDAERYLVIEIETVPGFPTLVTLRRGSNFSTNHILTAEVTNDKAIADLLYSVARLVTKTFIEPT